MTHSPYKYPNLTWDVGCLNSFPHLTLHFDCFFHSYLVMSLIITLQHVIAAFDRETANFFNVPKCVHHHSLFLTTRWLGSILPFLVERFMRLIQYLISLCAGQLNL